MSTLQLRLFGPFQLSVNGEPVAAPLWAKTQALLAYLAVEHDRPHRREALAGLLWPKQEEEQARNSLRQALHQLQRAIPGEFLLASKQTIQFNPDSDYTLDTARFIALLQTCDAHPHRHRDTCRACVQRLQQATQLYQGDLLSQLFLKDSTAFEEWAMVKREQLRQMAFSALGSVIRYHARRGEYAAMAGAAQQQLSPNSQSIYDKMLAPISNP